MTIVLCISQVRARCKHEWSLFLKRLAAADEAYLAEIQKG